MEILTLIHTPFKEKFGVPRQPLMIEEAWGKMSFPRNEFYEEAFRGIEEFSHLWLIFQFHQVKGDSIDSFHSLVRPPRFGGKKKLGVFATRSPHRPNRLGLSVVKLDRIEFLSKEVLLHVKGVDLVDGTPILDIKPYIPYVDRVDEAFALPFSYPPEFLRVRWECERPSGSHAELIEKVVGLDPRPGHDRTSQKEFGLYVENTNVRFREEDGEIVIIKVSK
jgi:tRNA-Thr(GGU) m(6)t(6)A37 methyltransferase TsaA